MEVNTKITYTYRDAENNKGRCCCVIDGLLTVAQQKKILDCLYEGDCFIPNAVGLNEERPFEYDPEIDHPFWELGEYSFEEVPQKPTVNVTPEMLVKAFVENKDKWEQLGVEYVPDCDLDYEDYGVLDIIQSAIGRADAIVEQVRTDKDVGLD